MTEKLKLRLVVEVEYEDLEGCSGEDLKQLERNLFFVADHACGAGLITRDTPATVLTFAAEVGEVEAGDQSTMAEKIKEVQAECGGPDSEHPAHSRLLWGTEAFSQNIQSGYWEWVVHQIEEYTG